jgi:hypothetical protein
MVFGLWVLNAPAQSAALQQAPGSAAVPDAPVPSAQSAAYNLGALSSSSLDSQAGAQDQQNPPQSSQPTDTLKKPIQQNPAPTRDPQTKRILGLIPNFRSVSTDQKLPPMTVKEKFLTATDDSFDYSSAFIPAALAGVSMARNATPEFGQGAVGYGRYFWHTALDQTSENYMVEFIFPAVTHEDNRYYTLGRGGFFKRTSYAVSRAVITRNDAGNETFNISEVVGSGASSGLSSLYYPTRERSFGNTASEWGTDIGIDAASFVVKEFWPDINRKLFHQRDPIQGASH